MKKSNPAVREQLLESVFWLAKQRKFKDRLYYSCDTHKFERWLQTELGFAFSREQYQGGNSPFWAWPESGGNRWDLAFYADSKGELLLGAAELKVAWGTGDMPANRSEAGKACRKLRRCSAAARFLLVCGVAYRYLGGKGSNSAFRTARSILKSIDASLNLSRGRFRVIPMIQVKKDGYFEFLDVAIGLWSC